MEFALLLLLFVMHAFNMTTENPVSTMLENLFIILVLFISKFVITSKSSIQNPFILDWCTNLMQWLDNNVCILISR